ncbi:MAG: YdeI/OmpD-associated family protein [Candidatus Thermoplasmatota archaeon]|jgi:uncharacterized protein YdeI (YjbR/CyaY-like superfamily)
MPSEAKVTFFASPAKFDAWLAKHGGKSSELLVGYWKVGTGKPSMTWAQSVEVALRHGWIDGMRRSLGAASYQIRFTPRKPGSHWSRINIALARRLLAEGRMTEAGQRAFAARTAERSERTSFEQQVVRMPPTLRRAFQEDAPAWEHFQSRPPWYRKAATWWVVSAKREETRARRFRQLVAASRQGLPIGQLDRAGEAKARASRPSRRNPAT